MYENIWTTIRTSWQHPVARSVKAESTRCEVKGSSFHVRWRVFDVSKSVIYDIIRLQLFRTYNTNIYLPVLIDNMSCMILAIYLPVLPDDDYLITCMSCQVMTIYLPVRPDVGVPLRGSDSQQRQEREPMKHLELRSMQREDSHCKAGGTLSEWQNNIQRTSSKIKLKKMFCIIFQQTVTSVSNSHT